MPPVLQQHEDVAEERRLGEIVRHEHDGLAEPLEDGGEIVLQLGAHERVEGAERLVEEQELGIRA